MATTFLLQMMAFLGLFVAGSSAQRGSRHGVRREVTSPHHHVCAGGIPECTTVGAYHVCLYGCSISRTDLALVLSVDHVDDPYPGKTPPWNIHHQNTLPSDFSVGVLGATCQGPRHSWSAVEVTCRLRQALDRPLLKVQYLLSSIGEAATHSIPLVPMKTQGPLQQCTATPLFGDVKEQLQYAKNMMRHWRRNNAGTTYVFGRTEAMCDALSQIGMTCAVRPKVSKTVSHYYDQTILAQVCLAYARHARARFLVLSDVDELPIAQLGGYLRRQWSEYYATEKAAGFRIWFDAASSCPRNWCPRDEKDVDESCGAARRPSWKPVVIPERTEFVGVHDFVPKAGFSIGPASYSPCLRHVRKHPTRCWYEEGRIQCNFQGLVQPANTSNVFEQKHTAHKVV